MDEQHKSSLSRLRPEAASTGNTVLVIDGNAAMLQTVTAIFHNSPFNCVTTGDSVSALCALVEERPFAVIVDADTGPLLLWQFCALIRQRAEFQSIWLIVSSSRDDVVERARASAAGADQFLPKPFAREEVLALLAAGMEAAA